jgi:hypothetical protein
MASYIEERRSKAAIWCLRLAVFLVPFFILVILLYRFAKIDAVQMFILIAFGLLIALLSLVFAFKAISELWTKGYRGGSQVVRGMIITLLVLMPFGYQAFLALQYPLANDVSTDMLTPPDYINAIGVRSSNADKGMNPVIEYDEEYSKKMILAYPKLQSRRYPAGPERVLEAVRTIIDENEWLLTGSQGIPELKNNAESENTTELADNNTETQAGEEQIEENIETPDDIYIEVLERTFVFGFENDVIIRIVSEDRNTLVDVRSSARWGKHDFGYNAKLIESFLQQLDAALLGIAGEG